MEAVDFATVSKFIPEHAMQKPHALPVLALCVIFLIGAVLPAAAASPPRGYQPADPSPILPDTSTATNQRIFLPAISAGPAVRVSAIELTQAIQNESQSVPMIVGRPTVARVFLQSSVTMPGQSVTLSAKRNGVALPGSPLRKVGVTARIAPNRMNAGDSINFLLPTAWLSGAVELTARVEQSGRSLSTTVPFQQVAPLRITIVPIAYVHAPTGKSYAAPTAVDFPASVQRMFPVPNVEVRWHAPLPFRGNVTKSASNRLADWDRLLNLVLAIKQSEGAANDNVYVGVLPRSIGSDHELYYVGIGTSMRATVNFDLQLAPAHELGHALARAHAPCGGVVNADPAYPYPGASIGALGFNTTNSLLLDPAVTTDLMSYCSEWVSDYTYMGMYANQRAVAVAVAASDQSPVAQPASGGPVEESVLVRASINSDGSVEILPVYALRAPAAQPMEPEQIANGEGSYTIAFVAADGATLATHEVPVVIAEEENLSIRLLSALLSMPAGTVAAVEVRNGPSVLARRSVSAHPTPAETPAVTVDNGVLAVRFGSDAPRLVRLAQDDRYTILAMDVTDGQLNLPLATVPGGSTTIEVIQADWLPQPGVAVASSAAPFELPDAQPLVTIAPPEIPLDGGGILIAGYASDAEDGILEGEWFINGESAARGPFLQIENTDTLPPSTVVELRAADSAGQSASTTLMLQPLQSATELPN
jgi:hypothetical protein